MSKVCPNGHIKEGKDLYVTPQGYDVCQACKRLRQKDRSKRLGKILQSRHRTRAKARRLSSEKAPAYHLVPREGPERCDVCYYWRKVLQETQ